MKKAKTLIALILAICTMFAVTASANAQTVTTTSSIGYTTTFGSDIFTVKYNGVAVTFPDAQPYIDSSNRTLVPVRFVAETMGATIAWNQTTQIASITKGNITVNVAIGNSKLTVTNNGTTSTVTMDTTAVSKDSRTYVPIRYVAEALGAWVGYSSLFNTVQIYADVLTPTEITRLHGYYDATMNEFFKQSGSSVTHTDAYYLDFNPQFSYFTGTNGFANANEWALLNPNKDQTYTGATTGKVYKYGTEPDVDYAKLVLSETVNGIDKGFNAAGKVTVSMRSDLSCVYASRHGSSYGTYVRGILHVSIPQNADITYIKANYPIITNPVAGESRDIDVEVYVCTYTGSVFPQDMEQLK